MFPDSRDLNFTNRPVRTRMPGGVAGAQSIMAAPYADLVMIHFKFLVSCSDFRSNGRVSVSL